MRRPIALFLLFMVALASITGSLHGLPHAGMDRHETAGVHLPMEAHGATDEAASCCSGEAQRAVPCLVLFAVLPEGPCGTSPAARSVSLAAVARHSEGIDPERLLDPPRA